MGGGGAERRIFQDGVKTGGREIRPLTHRIVFGTHRIRKIYSVPLRFHSEPLIKFRTSKSEVRKKCVMPYLNLTTNSVIIMTACTLFLCVNSEALQKIFFVYFYAA